VRAGGEGRGGWEGGGRVGGPAGGVPSAGRAEAAHNPGAARPPDDAEGTFLFTPCRAAGSPRSPPAYRACRQVIKKTAAAGQAAGGPRAHPHHAEDLAGGRHRRLHLLQVAGLAGREEEAGILRGVGVRRRRRAGPVSGGGGNCRPALARRARRWPPPWAAGVPQGGQTAAAASARAVASASSRRRVCARGARCARLRPCASSPAPKLRTRLDERRQLVLAVRLGQKAIQALRQRNRRARRRERAAARRGGAPEKRASRSWARGPAARGARRQRCAPSAGHASGPSSRRQRGGGGGAGRVQEDGALSLCARSASARGLCGVSQELARREGVEKCSLLTCVVDGPLTARGEGVL